MSNLKRLGCLVLAIALIGALITGCGAGKAGEVQQTATQSGTNQEAQQTTPGDGRKPAELKWYFPMPSQADQDSVFSEANKLIKEKLNATVNFNPIAFGDYNQKMQIIISAGDEFDFCFTSNTRADYFQNSARGAFIPLDELLDKYAPNLKKSVPEAFWNGTKVNGKIYGVLNYQISALTNGLFFKKDLVDKYSFNYSNVKKLEDLEPFFDSIKAGEQGIIPFAYQKATTNWGYLLGYYGYDEISTRNVPGAINFNDTSLKVVNQFASPEFKKHVDLMRSWYQKGYFLKDAAAVADWTTDLKAGKYAACFEGNHKPGGDSELKIKWGYDIVTAPISNPVVLTSSIVSTMQAISKSSKNPERVMEFLEYINTDKQIYNMLCFGIEGTHYKKVADSRIEQTADSKYNPGINWVFGSAFNAYFVPGQDDTVWEDTKKVNTSAKTSPLLGFAFDSAPVAAEIAQCKSAVDEFLPALDTGSVDVNEFLPKFLDKLKVSGVDKINEEMQRQIDAWKAVK